jgi:hypothetical protein
MEFFATLHGILQASYAQCYVFVTTTSKNSTNAQQAHYCNERLYQSLMRAKGNNHRISGISESGLYFYPRLDTGVFDAINALVFL